MKCKDCNYLVLIDRLSLMSRIIGYNAECSKAGILFNVDRSGREPLWCPLRDDDSQDRY